MLAEERRAILLNTLRENGYIQVSELAESLNISSATIRRDLTLLEKEGLCIRKRGGAIRSAQGTTLELPYEVKKHRFVEEKNRIAHEAVKLVENGDTIILDAGSTTYTLAQLLSSKQRLTVVTNDLQISVVLAANPNIYLVCTGGIARANVYTLQGAQVESFLETLRVDKTFLGADAIHEDGTIANVNIEEVAIKQAMIKAASQVVLLVDSSKFNVKGFAKVCDLEDINLIITDTNIPEKAENLLRERNTQFKAA
ncbi:MAG TPA: DeoR/GlpR transcriptional regulator [Anaerolineae bacterium]|nr:DeoR/GlpR transcriptional regulator [Anaerolineae bacterium]